MSSSRRPSLYRIQGSFSEIRQKRREWERGQRQTEGTDALIHASFIEEKEKAHRPVPGNASFSDHVACILTAWDIPPRFVAQIGDLTQMIAWCVHRSFYLFFLCDVPLCTPDDHSARPLQLALFCWSVCLCVIPVVSNSGG